MLNVLSNYLTQVKHINSRQVFVPVVLIFAMLFSLVSHSTHFDLTTDLSGNIAEQDCHLCQQNIDNVDASIEIAKQHCSRYSTYSPRVYKLTSHANHSITPPLRAPPVTH